MNRAVARAVVTDATTQTFEVGGGYGHYGAEDDLVVHAAGLADHSVAEVTARWPDAGLSTETFVLATGWRYRWRQGEDVVAVMP